MKNKLKPCPFCGGKAVLKVNYVKCTQCYARTGQYDIQEEAKKSWNTRAVNNAVESVEDLTPLADLLK